MNVPEALRLRVWQRAQGRCEYGLIHEEEFLFPHQIDHIRAVQHGGLTLAENLDGAFVRGLTPVGRATVFLLRFNSEDRVRLRRRLQREGRFPVHNAPPA